MHYTSHFLLLHIGQNPTPVFFTLDSSFHAWRFNFLKKLRNLLIKKKTLITHSKHINNIQEN